MPFSMGRVATRPRPLVPQSLTQISEVSGHERGMAIAEGVAVASDVAAEVAAEGADVASSLAASGAAGGMEGAGGSGGADHCRSSHEMARLTKLGLRLSWHSPATAIQSTR